MTRTSLILMATLGSAGLLLAALGFQYLGGLLPCVLCLWQRWPHVLAVFLGLASLRLKGPALPLLAALAALASAGIGGFHVGVEQGWWPGLQQCAVNNLSGVAASDLLNTDITVGAPVACDKIAWSFLGLSMAAWNTLISTGIAGIWLVAARKG
jgi:disulfide bond formation protein DsbB